MDKETFIKLLRDAVNGFDKAISTEDGNWVVKGFIDVHKNIYTISLNHEATYDLSLAHPIL